MVMCRLRSRGLGSWARPRAFTRRAGVLVNAADQPWPPIPPSPLTPDNTPPAREDHHLILLSYLTPPSARVTAGGGATDQVRQVPGTGETTPPPASGAATHAPPTLCPPCAKAAWHTGSMVRVVLQCTHIRKIARSRCVRARARREPLRGAFVLRLLPLFS